MLSHRKLSHDSASPRYKSMGHHAAGDHVDHGSGCHRKEKEKVSHRLSSWISSSISKAKQLPKYRSRRASKSFDHGKVMRDMLSTLTTRDIIQLNDEYHSTAILKELSFQAEAARPSASHITNDLSELYDSQYVADTFLVFRGIHLPVHKAIICVRSPFFRELLGKVNVFGSRVPVHISDPNVRPEMLSDVLRFLYCGQLVCSQNPVIDGLSSKSPNSTYESLLIRLSEQFAGSHDLDRDLKHLLETGLYSDASLVFSGQSVAACSISSGSSGSSFTKSCRACTDQSEYSCHSSVLASRSVFFRNVVQRHQRRFEEESVTINTANQKIRIVLDESIIPRRFARIILHSMYRDSTDLSSLLPYCVCKCYTISPTDGQVHPASAGAASSSSAGTSQPGSSVGQSMHSLSSTSTLLAPGGSGIGQQQSAMQSSHGMSTSASSSVASFASIGAYNSTANYPLTTASSPVPANGASGNYVKEIMDLYEIARFLELDSLIQSCEDMMIESLTIETLVPILKWSEQPHGSPWVRRQALTFLREEFSTISASAVLMNLEQSHLLDVVKSDFLQSSELEILQAIIRWGENRLIKRMEEREPNVVSQTAHSLRRGVRKRDLNDSELRDIISDVMKHVRIAHILPHDSEILTSAAKRGLVPHMPPCMTHDDHSDLPAIKSITPAAYWIRAKYPSTGSTKPFTPPRFFTPYVEEAKSYLEERLRKPADGLRVRSHSQAAASSASTSLLDHNHHFYLPNQPHQTQTMHHPSRHASIHSHHQHHPHQHRSVTPGAHSSGSGHSHTVPDTLYMVDHNRSQSIADFNNLTTSTSSEIYSTCCSPAPPLSCFERSDRMPASDALSVADPIHDPQTIHTISSLPVIEQRILVLMKQREQELKSSSTVSVSSVPNSKCEVSRLIQLRVVREFGLPDAAAEVLHNTASYVPYPATETTESANDDTTTASYGVVGMAPSSGVLSNVGSNGALQSDKDIYCYPSDVRSTRSTDRPASHHPAHPHHPHSAHHQSLPSSSPIPPPIPPITAGCTNAASDSFLQFSFEDEYLGGKFTRIDTMPDIALATSALAEMHLFKRSTESLAQQPPPPQRPSQGFDPMSTASSSSASTAHNRVGHYLP